MNPSAFRLPPSDLGGRAPRLPFWAVALALLAAFALTGHIDLQVEKMQDDGRRTADETRRSSVVSRHSVDLRDCTPHHIPVSPLVEFTIIHHPDGPYAAGCTRYAASNRIPAAAILARETRGERREAAHP